MAVFGDSSPQPDMIRSTIYSDLSNIAKGNSDDVVITNLADMYTYLYMSLSSLNSKVEIGHSQDLGTRVTKLERELEYIDYENSQLKLHLASIEDATKYMNLRIEGMNESNNNKAGPKQKGPVSEIASQGAQSNINPSQAAPKCPVTPSNRQVPRTTADYFTPKHGDNVSASQPANIVPGQKAVTSAPGTVTISEASQTEQQRPIRSSQRVSKKVT